MFTYSDWINHANEVLRPSAPENAFLAVFKDLNIMPCSRHLERTTNIRDGLGLPWEKGRRVGRGIWGGDGNVLGSLLSFTFTFYMNLILDKILGSQVFKNTSVTKDRSLC